MAVNTKETESAGGIVVRSRLSQAYENMKSGVFPEGFDDTKLEEPSMMLNAPKDFVFETELTPAAVEQIGSVNLTLPKLVKLADKLDIKFLEKKLDAWTGENLHRHMSSQGAELVSNLVKDKKLLLQSLYNLQVGRFELIGLIHDILAKTQSFHLMNAQPFQQFSLYDARNPDLGGFLSPKNFVQGTHPLSVVNAVESHHFRLIQMLLDASGHAGTTRVINDAAHYPVLTLDQYGINLSHQYLSGMYQDLYELWGGSNNVSRIRDSKSTSTSTNIVQAVHHTQVCIDYGISPEAIYSMVDSKIPDGDHPHTLFSPIDRNFPVLKQMGNFSDILQLNSFRETVLRNVDSQISEDTNVFAGFDVDELDEMARNFVVEGNVGSAGSSGGDGAAPTIPNQTGTVNAAGDIVDAVGDLSVGQVAGNIVSPPFASAGIQRDLGSGGQSVRSLRIDLDGLRIPEHDLNKSNLYVYSSRHPAQKLSALLSNARNPEGNIDTTTLPWIAKKEVNFIGYLASVVWSEVVQSGGYVDAVNFSKESTSVKNVNRRSGTLLGSSISNNFGIRAIGGSTLGQHSHMKSVFNIQSHTPQDASKLETIVNSRVETVTPPPGPQMGRDPLSGLPIPGEAFVGPVRPVIEDVFLYEKAASSRPNLSNEGSDPVENPEGIKDLYTKYVSDLLDPEVDEEKRSAILTQLVTDFEGNNQLKINEYSKFISKLYQKGQYNDQDATQHERFKQLNPVNIFGILHSRIIHDLCVSLEINNAAYGHPYTYWTSQNNKNKESDRTLIAQVIALIKTATGFGTGQFDNENRVILRNHIVNAVIARDISRARNQNFDATSHHKRCLGYVPSTIYRECYAVGAAGSAHHRIDHKQYTCAKAMGSLNSFNGFIRDRYFSFEHDDQRVEYNVTLHAKEQIFKDLIEDLGFDDQDLQPGSARMRNVVFDPYVSWGEDQEPGAAAAFAWLRQGDGHTPYRVTRYSSALDFLDRINGKKTIDQDYIAFGPGIQPIDPKNDLYDHILGVVDTLDAKMFAHETGQQTAERAPTPDGRPGLTIAYNEIPSIDPIMDRDTQKDLFGTVVNGYFHPFAGSTRANGFDRGTLISIVVEAAAHMLALNFQPRIACQAGNQVFSHVWDQLGAEDGAFDDSLIGFFNGQLMCEIVQKSISNAFPMDRDRRLDKKSRNPANQHPGHVVRRDLGAPDRHPNPQVDVPTNHRERSMIGYSISLLRDIHAGIEKVTLDAGMSVRAAKRSNYVKKDRITATLIRAASNGPAVNLQSRILLNFTDDPDPVAADGGFLDATPESPDGILASGEPNLFNVQAYHDGEVMQPGFIFPDAFTYHHRPRELPLHTVDGGYRTVDMLEDVADVMVKIAYQVHAPTKGILCIDGINEVYSEATRAALGKSFANHTDEKNQAQMIKDHRDEVFANTEVSVFAVGNNQIPMISPPREVSLYQCLAQMEKTKTALRAMYGRDEVQRYNTSAGFYARSLNYYHLGTIGAKAFLEDLARRYASPALATRKMVFYGVRPNLFYQRFLTETENGRAGGKRMQKFGKDDLLSSTIYLDFEFDRFSQVEPELKFQRSTLFGDYDLTLFLPEQSIHRSIIKLINGDLNSYEDLVRDVKLINPFSLSPSALTEYDVFTGVPFLFEKITENDGSDATVTYSELVGNRQFAGDPDRIFKLIRNKVDDYFMNFIIEQNVGLSLSSRNLGCFDRKYLTYDLQRVLTMMNVNLSTPNTQNGTAELFKSEDIVSSLIQKTPLQSVEIIDQLVHNKKITRNAYERAPYDSDFKAKLRPYLQREDGDLEPRVMPPIIQNDEIRIVDLLSESILFKDLAFMKPPTFDHTIIFEVPDDYQAFTPFDYRNSGMAALDAVPNAAPRPGGAGDIPNALHFYVKPSLLQIYEYTRLDILHPRVISKIDNIRQR